MISDRDPVLASKLPRLRREHRELYWMDLAYLGEGYMPSVLFRSLTRREFAFAEQDAQLGLDATDEILRAAVVWPVIGNWDNILTNPFYDLPYKAFDWIAEMVVEVSGFASNGAIAQSIVGARAALSNIDAVMTTAICSAFSMKPKDIDDLPLWDISRLFAMAESALPHDIDVRLFLDPEYAESVMRKEQRKKQRESRVPNGMPGRMTRTNTNGAPPVPEGYQSTQYEHMEGALERPNPMEWSR